MTCLKLLLSSSVSSPPSLCLPLFLCPCLGISGSWTVCILLRDSGEERRGDAEVIECHVSMSATLEKFSPTVTLMVQPQKTPFRCSWAMCLTPISPRGQQWLQGSNSLFQTCIYRGQAFSFREQRAVIIIRHLFCSLTLPCCLHQNISPSYINII